MVISWSRNHNKVRRNHNVVNPDHNKLCERVAKNGLPSTVMLANDRRLWQSIIINPAGIIMRQPKARTKSSILPSAGADQECQAWTLPGPQD